MLILNRKSGEKVMIGDDVTIVVTKIEHGRVYLGFEAPDTLTIHREEVYRRIQNGEFRP